MKFINQLLSDHFLRYPKMELSDIYKLLHQAAMGPGHAVDDPVTAAARLRAEAKALGDGADDPLADPISPDGKLARIHLRAYVAGGYEIDALLGAFLDTAHTHVPASDKLEKFCGCLGDLAAAGGIPLTRAEVELYFNSIAEQGYPVVRHSATYRELYRPAYRVVSLEYLPTIRSHTQ